MKILVDADACPVKELIEQIACSLGIAVEMFIDTAHELRSTYSRVELVDKGADAVDLALVRRACPGDIVVTHDYGLAALALSRGCYAMCPDGLEFTGGNIDRLLLERYLNAKQRRAGERVCHVKRRGRQRNNAFSEKFRLLCIRAQNGRI